MENKAIIIEQMYNVPAAKVWKALTDSREMKLWYFDIPGFRPETGFEFQFWGGPDENRQYLHLCKITKAIPEKILVHTWQYKGYVGNTTVKFELIENGQTTTLKLTHNGLESFPTDNPDFAKRNFEEGWKWIIETALKEYLEK